MRRHSPDLNLNPVAPNNSFRELHSAASDGKLQRVQELVQGGCEVDVVNPIGDTAAMVAAKAGHVAIVKYLAGQGADLRHRNSVGWNVFICMAYCLDHRFRTNTYDNKLDLMNWLLDEKQFAPTQRDINTACLVATGSEDMKMPLYLFRRFGDLVQDNATICDYAGTLMDLNLSFVNHRLDYPRRTANKLRSLKDNTLLELSFGEDQEFIHGLISMELRYNTSVKKVSCGQYPDENILRFLKHNPALEELTFTHYGSSPETIRNVIVALRANPGLKLKKLSFISVKINEEDATVLAEFLRHYMGLEELELRCCDLGPKAAATIIDAINSNPSSLRRLDLTNNKIGVDGARALSRLLANKQSRLQSLSVALNHNLDGGFNLLPRAMASNTTVTELDISSLFCRNDGFVEAIAAMIAENQAIINLRLHYNDFYDHQGVMIADALKGNSTMQTLDLRASSGAGNDTLGVATAEALGAMLKSNKSLRELNLSGNTGIDGGEHFLLQGLQTNRTLTSIPYGRYGSYSTAISACLERNKRSADKMQHLQSRMGAFGDGTLNVPVTAPAAAAGREDTAPTPMQLN